MDAFIFWIEVISRYNATIYPTVNENVTEIFSAFVYDLIVVLDDVNASCHLMRCRKVLQSNLEQLFLISWSCAFWQNLLLNLELQMGMSCPSLLGLAFNQLWQQLRKSSALRSIHCVLMATQLQLCNNCSFFSFYFNSCMLKQSTKSQRGWFLHLQICGCRERALADIALGSCSIYK